MLDRYHSIIFSKSRVLLAGALTLGFVVACSSADETEGSPEQVTGTLVKFVGRDNEGKTFTYYEVSSNKKRTRLVGDESLFQKTAPNSRVNVTGTRSQEGGAIEVDKLEPMITEGQISEALSSSAPAGKVAAFLIRDAGAASVPFTKEEAANTLFNASTSTNKYFQEVSYGNYSVTGSIYGWYTVNMPDCGAEHAVDDWLDAAKAQAVQQDGYVSDNFRHEIAIFERSAGDCFLAVGTVGQPDATGLVFSFWLDSDVFAHELGHNIGFGHANLLACENSGLQSVPFGTRCLNREYADPYDAMGFAGTYFHFNSFNKKRENWLPAANTVRVTTAGSFTIVPQERSSTGKQGLLIPIPGSTDSFHVEMREQFGFDNQSRFNGAVLIRRVNEAGFGSSTYLIDSTPQDSADTSGLAVGQTFSDPVSGITIKLVSRSSSQSVVAIAFNGPTCSDGQKNGSETDLDCGGLCGGCATGKVCSAKLDCSGYACSAGHCVDASGGLTASYYRGQNFDELLTTRVDKAIDFNWGDGGPLSETDNFSVRWVGKIVPPTSDTYTFRVESDDGVRLWVNGVALIDHWNDPTSEENSIALQAGQQYDIKLEYVERGGGAFVRLYWSAPTRSRDVPGPEVLIPTSSPNCTLASALDLGARTTTITVPSNACVKVSNFPSWWQFTPGLVTVQSGTGTFPVPGTWTNTCTQATGQFTLNQAWQTMALGNFTASCPALIKLNGSGAPLQLSWW